MTDKIIHIGVLGTANIAVRSIIQPASNNGKCKILGVASRDIQKAKNYAETHGIPRCFPDYNSLIAEKEIDVVYIPLINSLHAEWIIKSAEAGKHILVEKPICLNAKEIGEIRTVVNRNNVHILEAIMVQHHPFIAMLKDIFVKKEFGELLSMHTHMSVLQSTNENYRFDPVLGGGVFYDMAPYWLFAVQQIMGLDYKSFDGYSAFHGLNNSDLSFDASLLLKSGVKCTFMCSFEQALKADYSFDFELATIVVKNFLRPAIGNNIMSIIIEYKNIPQKQDKIKFEPQNYYDNQLEFFLQVVQGKQTNISIEDSFARIALLQEMYQYARNKGF